MSLAFFLYAGNQLEFLWLFVLETCGDNRSLTVAALKGYRFLTGAALWGEALWADGD